MTMRVSNQELSFLVDTGARYSTITTSMPQSKLSSDCVQVVGFSGKEESLPLKKPLRTTVAGQVFHHQFVQSEACPINLMGRDLLIKCGASVLCSTDGLLVTFPNGGKVNCSVTSLQPSSHMMLAAECGPQAPTQWADIYWGLLDSDDISPTGVVALFTQWRPWLQSLHPYAPPVDPYHVTLKYDRDGDEVYQHAFYDQLDGHRWQITSSSILAGPEGVAAAVTLTDQKKLWCEMPDEAEPHVTLMVHAGHQAKELGPMTKRLQSTTDWVHTQIPGLQYSPSCTSYKIVHHTKD